MMNNLHKPGKLFLQWIFCLLAINLMVQPSLYAQELAANQSWNNQDGLTNKVSLKKMLETLGSEYKVEFAFDDRLVMDKYVLPEKKVVESLDTRLNLLLTPLQLQYKKINDHYYVIQKSEEKEQNIRKVEKKPIGYASPSSTGDSFSKVLTQQKMGGITIMDKTISGTVTGEDGETLPGVNIVVKNTTVGTVTDVEGNYRLTVSDDAEILVFSSIGYITKEVAINNQTVINVALSLDIKSLEEIVVVGYTQQSRMLTTSSISSINDEEMKNIPSVSPVQALQGKMAGVSIPVLSGQPGAAANIVIRGGTTLDPFGSRAGGEDVNRREPSDPLIVVDGVFRSMDDINPDDIESIQVMKDAASTAIYGARGANGVIMVTTKTGKGVGKARVNFRYQHGFETQARNYDYLNAREFLTLARPVMARGIDY